MLGIAQWKGTTLHITFTSWLSPYKRFLTSGTAYVEKLISWPWFCYAGSQYDVRWNQLVTDSYITLYIARFLLRLAQFETRQHYWFHSVQTHCLVEQLTDSHVHKSNHLCAKQSENSWSFKKSYNSCIVWHSHNGVMCFMWQNMSRDLMTHSLRASCWQFTQIETVSCNSCVFTRYGREVYKFKLAVGISSSKDGTYGWRHWKW